MFVSHALLGAAEIDFDPENGEVSAAALRKRSPKNALKVPEVYHSTIVGVGTKGLGAECEHHLLQISKEKFNEWKMQKDRQGVGRPAPPPPKVDCKAFYDRSKQHHNDVREQLIRHREKLTKEIEKERKEVKKVVNNVRESAIAVRRKLVEGEKERRRVLKEEAREGAQREKEKMLQDKEQTQTERILWQEQHAADAEYREQCVQQAKEQRRYEKEISLQRKSLQEKERLEQMAQNRETMNKRWKKHTELVGLNTAGRKEDVQKLHDQDVKGREVFHKKRENYETKIRKTVVEMRKDQKQFQSKKKAQTNESGAEAARLRSEEHARMLAKLETARTLKHQHADELRDEKKRWIQARAEDQEEVAERLRLLVQEVKCPRFGTTPRSPREAAATV